MARRRMFSLDIVDTDKFACMSKNARYLYYELGIRADDDGFIGAPMRIIRMTDCVSDDLDELIKNRFIIPFETGVIVVKDWKVNNQIRSDRYKPTLYAREKEMLSEVNGEYLLTDGKPDVIPSDIPNGKPAVNHGYDTGEPQESIGEVRVGKESIGKESIGEVREEEGKPLTLSEASGILFEPEEIVQLFNSICTEYKPVTDKLSYSQQLSDCVLKGYKESDYIQAFKKAEASDYLKGLTENKTYPSDFGWILEHLEEILHGKYDTFKKNVPDEDEEWYTADELWGRKENNQ